MESHSLILNHEKYKLPLQIIELKNSFFVYIGNGSLKMENLILGFSCGGSSSNEPNSYKDCSYSTSILNEVDSTIGRDISERLSFEFKMPFYVSMNIEDGFLNFELRILLENSIKKFIHGIISKRENSK